MVYLLARFKITTPINLYFMLGWQTVSNISKKKSCHKSAFIHLWIIKKLMWFKNENLIQIKAKQDDLTRLQRNVSRKKSSYDQLVANIINKISNCYFNLIKHCQCNTVTYFIYCVKHNSRNIMCFINFCRQNILTYHLNNYCPVICSIPTRYVPKIHGVYLKEVRKVCKETDRDKSINYRNIIIIIFFIISFIIFLIIIIIIVKNRRLFWWMVIPYRFILYYHFLAYKFFNCLFF